MTKLAKRKPDSLKAQATPYGSNSTVTIASQIANEIFSGPVPPPSHLAQYDALVPGTAKRFLDSFFEESHFESNHRRSLENKIVDEDIKLRKRSQWCAFSLSLLTLLGAFTFIFFGYGLEGLGALLLGLGALVGTFFYAKFAAPNSYPYADPTKNSPSEDG